MTSRQSRESEKIVDQIIHEVRSLDKIVWNGHYTHQSTIEEIRATINARFDELSEAYKKEFPAPGSKKEF